MKNETHKKSQLSLINQLIARKYKIEGEITTESVFIAQRKTLYNDIKSKYHHQKLYKMRENELACIKGSSIWLKNGNNLERREGAFCYLQDRNMFAGTYSVCPHCRLQPKTVEHLATRCDRMLGHNYTRRHNEVVRCIHLQMCNKYGFKRSKRILSHSVQEIIENDNAEIRVDTRIGTDILIAHNKPDICIFDKKNKEILIIEIGITNQDSLLKVENGKLRKYDILANKLGMMHKCKTKIIPYVLTWDGVVTIYHKKYMKELGLTLNTEAYIQSIVLKKTLESISLER